MALGLLSGLITLAVSLFRETEAFPTEAVFLILQGSAYSVALVAALRGLKLTALPSGSH